MVSTELMLAARMLPKKKITQFECSNGHPTTLFLDNDSPITPLNVQAIKLSSRVYHKKLDDLVLNLNNVGTTSPQSILLCKYGVSKNSVALLQKVNEFQPN